ncbi:hypothetical protein LTR15_008159 [Elasticomyces elasticus]|nr:hypothetical protein LTR15_008159 [Elasticomyces elasticus]
MPVPVQVAYKAIGKPEVGVNNYQGFMPGKTDVLRKGWSRDGAKALESDIRIDHDVEIKVRDGCRLYLDIYRPADFPEKIPIIIGWSCYGKKYSALEMLPMTVWQCCVTKNDLSGIEKFEGVDPQLWYTDHGLVLLRCILRASHRAFDPKKSIHPQFPFHPHENEEKVKPGEVVKLEIGIWAMGNDFDAGESISVQISGQMPIIAEYSACSEALYFSRDEGKDVFSTVSSIFGFGPRIYEFERVLLEKIITSRLDEKSS